MRKVLFLATAALFFIGTTFAGTDKGKKKKCAKGKTCCSQKKACDKKEKSNTAEM